MREPKYVEAQEVKDFAAVHIADPILLLSINSLMDAVPGAPPPAMPEKPERRPCPSCGGDGVIEVYDLRENPEETEGYLYRIACLCGRCTPWCRSLENAVQDWNTQVTNADLIRAMTDEKLAEFMMVSSSIPCDTKMTATCKGCESCMLEWLQERVMEGSASDADADDDE